LIDVVVKLKKVSVISKRHHALVLNKPLRHELKPMSSKGVVPDFGCLVLVVENDAKNN
jgi:hypothetical protein